MVFKSFFVYIVLVPHLITCQLTYLHPNQYGLSVNGDMFQQQMHPQQHQMQQQQQQQQQQQLPMHQQQQSQQQHQIHQQQQGQIHPQQQYYQGNIQDPSIQTLDSMQPIQPIQPFGNQFQQPTNDHLGGQVAASSSLSPSERYLVGNLSESFSFQVAPPAAKVTYLGLNGYSLYITGMGFSNKSKFSYDEQNNLLTILSLDTTTVGYYSAVDTNWQTFLNILSAINVSSLQIHNAHTTEDNNGSSLVSCSVSIVRSTFKLSEPPSLSNNLAILPPPSLPSSSITSSVLPGTENLPRLNLFLSSHIQSSMLLNNKVYNDTLNEHIFTRTITIKTPLTRADHNGTIQCQVESNNNIDVFLIKTAQINIEYGPNLESGAPPVIQLESEALKVISMECQVEANPTPSYIWYDMSTNISTGMMPFYGQQNLYNQQNLYGQQYPFQSPSNMPTSGSSVFSTTRQVQRFYQYPGQHAMQCQAQSRGKTIKQDFFITVLPSSSGQKAGINADGSREKSYKTPMIIGLVIGGILLLLLIALMIAVIIFLKRRKSNTNEKSMPPQERVSNDKPGKFRSSHSSNLPIDHSKYKRDLLKGDSSSTSHLVESAENSTSQAPSIPTRSSPIPSTHSSYRQAPVPVPVSYQEANTFPGSRTSRPMRSYSPAEDDGDDNDASVHAMPLATNRSRTTTQFGSHKSLSESIQSLRSNQQPGLSLPVKKQKRSQEAPSVPPTIPKRDQQMSSPKSLNAKKDYQYHHYHNPTELGAQQKLTHSDVSSEDDELKHSQSLNDAAEDSAFLPKKFIFRVRANAVPLTKSTSIHNQKEYKQPHQYGRQVRTPPPPQQMAVHQPTTVRHDDVPPPPYRQTANSSSASSAYVYHEPTEV